MLFNCNINRAINKNLTFVENLYANNSFYMIKKVLIGGGKKR